MRPRRRPMWQPLFLGLVSLCLPCAASLAAHDIDVTSIGRMFLDQIGERRYLLSVVDMQMPPMLSAAGAAPCGLFACTGRSGRRPGHRRFCL